MINRQIVTLYAGIDFWAQGEICEGYFFIHCDVYKNDLKTLRKIKEGIKVLKEALIEKGYTKPLYTYTKNGRWVKLIDGEYLTSFIEDNEEYEVWTWQLEQ